MSLQIACLHPPLPQDSHNDDYIWTLSYMYISINISYYVHVYIYLVLPCPWKQIVERLILLAEISGSFCLAIMSICRWHIQYGYGPYINHIFWGHRLRWRVTIVYPSSSFVFHKQHPHQNQLLITLVGFLPLLLLYRGRRGRGKGKRNTRNWLGRPQATVILTFWLQWGLLQYYHKY